MGQAVLRWGALSACYLAFAGSLSRAELAAAAAAGAFAAALPSLVRRTGGGRLRLSAAWLSACAPLPWRLARDTARVALALVRAMVRRHEGRCLLDPEAAATPSGAGAGQRAAAALLASVAPDGIALETSDTALPVHRLSLRGQPPRGGGRP